MRAESEAYLAARGYRWKVIWLTVPAFVALVIELVGGWRFGKDMYSEKYAIHLGPLYLVVVPLVFAIILVAPFLIVRGFIMVFSKWNLLRAQGAWLAALLLLLTMSLTVSMFSCAWSCGGHPTWTNGYGGYR